LPKPQQLVQAVHAAYDAGRFFDDSPTYVPSVVVCAAESEDEVKYEAARLEAKGIRTTVFREPDIDDQVTALATEPLSRRGRRLVAKWRMWKGD